ncbi:MAG: excinuclease ABC subunit UvrC [Verrucomicrobiota bacterium]
MSEKINLSRHIRELPHKPGVYLFRDRIGRVIYVGKARDLRKRVSQYFHPSRKRRADIKTRALVECVYDIQTHIVKSEPEAILLEGKLIKEYQPKYNVSFRDDKRFLIIKIILNDPFPRFQLTRIRKNDGARYFGPFAHSTSVQRTMEFLKKNFHLRSCSPRLPGEEDYKHCLDHIIKNCSAPCVKKISQEDYKKNAIAACEFLEGKSAEWIGKLKAEMGKASEKMNFEKAAQLRDMMESIQRTTKQEKKFWKDFPTAIVPEKDLEELRDALKLPAIPEIIECFDISNISDTHKVASMVCFKNGRAHKQSYRRYRIKTVQGQDDFASMAEVVKRRYSRVTKEASTFPDLIVVDGGKGQLSAALKELERLKIFQQPLIGLAKQEEEIFLPRNPNPLWLPRKSGALKLLQRVRDEAHRFANAYHQLLMKKRIAESVLDDCPGMSRNKKTALLRHFGSIENIRKATVEQLATVQGVSPRLANQIFVFLHRN